jgi:nucleotide-binding universal stress UspA family protein
VTDQRPGSTLKQIRDQTNVRIDIPKREEVLPANGQAAGPGSDGEEEEPTIAVTIIGPRPSVLEAQDLLKQIIAAKTSKTTQRVKDIPANILPFIIARRPVFIAAAEGGEIKLTLNQIAREISVSGDREAVGRVIETIKSHIEQLKSGLTAIKVALPKRQHRLLIGGAAEKIMAKAKCSVTVSASDDPSDEVSVWGQPADLPAGLQAVMDQANSQFIKEYQLPGPVEISRQLLTYLSRSSYLKDLSSSRTQVSVHAPDLLTLNNVSSINIDLVGDKSQVEAVHAELSGFVSKLSGATREIPVDWLLHRIISTKQAKK